MKFAQESAFQSQLPGSRTRQRRDRGASHHGELAAQRPRTPGPGLGQGARARGTHLGRAAEARGGEGGRGSRHVASSYFLLFSLTRGCWRGSEGPRKTFFQVAFGVAKLFCGRARWLPAVGSRSAGRSVFRSAALGGGPFLSAGKVGQSPVPLRPPARIACTLAREPAGCAPRSPRAPPTAGTGSGCRPLRPRTAAARPAPAAVPPAIRTLAGAALAAQRPAGAPGSASTWRGAGGSE